MRSERHLKKPRGSKSEAGILRSFKGKGCAKDVNWEKGGIQRVTLDRTSPLYQAIYTQRTSCERINSQAKELGIERPKVRNGQSVANLNTLTYVIINVRALNRAKSINRGLLQMNELHPSRMPNMPNFLPQSVSSGFFTSKTHFSKQTEGLLTRGTLPFTQELW